MNQRTLLFTLVGSIALNTFLLGVLSVHAFSKRSPFGGSSRPADCDGRGGGIVEGASLDNPRGPGLLRDLVRAAGGRHDPRVKELLAGHRQQLGAMHQEVAASRERVLEVLEHEPFDRAALAQSLAHALETRQRVDKLANEGVVELASKLEPPERAQVSEHARKRRPGPEGTPRMWRRERRE